MGEGILLSDKFSAGSLPEVCAPRHALLSLFDRAAGKRVVYVSAPAGHGKTVSTLLWLKSSERRVIWIGLDSYDNTTSIFYKLCCTGILSVQPKNKAMADILKSPGFSSSPVEHTIRMLDEFELDDRQYALVLDDMHLVTNEEIRKSCLLVQKRLPASFVVLVLTRNEVSEEYIAITGEDKCAVITARDLAFSAEEVRKYFNAYGRFITESETMAIHAVSEGWAIGVTALARSGQMDMEKNSGRVLDNYIKTHIWDRLDASMRDFMLRTSVTDELTGELCERLSGRGDSGEILEHLSGSNFFVRRTAGGIYLYHHLFLEFLRCRVKDEGVGIEPKELNRLAAEYYMERGEYLKTQNYAVKSGDAETIMGMMFSAAPYTNPSVDEYANFSRILYREAMPGDILEQFPFLYVPLIGYSLIIGDAWSVERYMDRLYDALPVVADKFPKHYGMCVVEMSLDYRHLLSEQIRHFEQLLPTVGEKSAPHMVSLTLQMPFMHRSSRDFYELSDEKTAQRMGLVFGSMLQEDSEILIGGIRSGLLLEQNRIKDALEVAMRINRLTTGGTSGELKYAILLNLAAVYDAQGNSLRRDEVLAETEQYIMESGAPYLRPNLLAYKTKVMLLDGDKSAAVSWLEQYFVTVSEQLELYKIFQHFTTARSYMALGRTDDAMSLILKLKRLGADFMRPLDAAEAGVMQAVLEWALGRRKEAQATLEGVLMSLQDHGFVRVVADEGAAVLPILKKLNNQADKEDYNGSLDPRYLHGVLLAAYEESKRSKGVITLLNAKPVKLSKQQTRIITLLAKGYKYTDIMAETGLTIHTVKSHASTAYAKLGVNNSIDAAIKAREMGLIG